LNYYISAKGNEEFVEKVLKSSVVEGVEIELVDINKMDELNLHEDDHLIVTGRVSEIKKVMQFAYEKSITMGIIPMSEQKELMATFELPSKLEPSIELALKKCEKQIDLLFCEDILVLQEVVIGEVPPLDSFSSSMEKQSLWERTKSFFSILKKVRHLQHTNFTITTAKESVLKFSAIGAVAVEYNNRTFASKLIAKYLKFNDARLSLILLSPSSILQYMGYIFQSHILKQTPEVLPNSVGYIHSHKLYIETETEQTITIDSQCCLQTPVTLETKEEALTLAVGEEFWKKSSKVKEIKESIKVSHLPSDDEMSAYLGKSIPLFSHASKEQFAALFVNLREESRLSSTFMTLLILATMIATFGLYINSASVIIGAMLLAPLMQPIVGVSMGLLRQDASLLTSASKSVAVGVLAVMFTSMFIAILLPIEQLTSEMNGRLSPTILDMFVAIVSGIAAAYAKSNEKIIGSLAGVAIAVALVPPIAVAGVGLGWGEWTMFSSAFLLFITNLVGIILAASLTFLMLGFSPLSVAKKGIFYAMILVSIVSVPLYISFTKMRHDIEVKQTLGDFETTLGDKVIHLRNIEIQGKEVRCEVIASDILSKEEKQELNRRIAQEVGEEVKVLVSFWYAL
jgi:uncharacterized hydrophobic protein (TIGR00271 family)